MVGRRRSVEPWGEDYPTNPTTDTPNAKHAAGGPADGHSATPDLAFLDNLNPEQREAATYTGGPLLILAGAGSGKTRCLTYRFAYLVRHFGIHPGRILAITFTNKAARQMRDRIERLVGGHLGEGGSRAGGAAGSGEGERGSPSRLGEAAYAPRGESLWISTFHSTCARLLRRYGTRVGLGPNFAIYDADDQVALMKQVVAEQGWDESRWPAAGLLHAIGRAKDELVSPADLAARARDLREERAAKAYAIYQEHLGRNNAADFDDLILKAVSLFRENHDILESLRERFVHVLIDEYQDTNHAQYVFANLLAAGHRNLCVVGDDDQSIYRWRGADIRNVLEFEEDYPDAKVIRLERNYRSTKTILKAANGVIANNRQRKGKTLWTDAEAGDPVVYYLADDEREEAEFVAGEVLGGHKGRDLPYRAFAVLYRTHAQSRAFEDVFIRKAIPYQIIGGVRFYERKEIKDVLAYLKVVANPADEVSLDRALGVPKRGIGPQTLARLRDLALVLAADQADQAESAAAEPAAPAEPAAWPETLTPPPGLYAAIKAVVAGTADPGGIGPKLRAELGRFTALIDKLAARSASMPVADMVREVAEKSGMVDALRREGTPEADARIENIQELATVATDFARHSDDSSLATFLETAALIADIDVMREGDDGVVLMSMHNAKGLEFPYVFVAGLEQGLFPHQRSLEEQGGLEEERRLCYVAMTRAQKRLYVSHARARSRYGYALPGEASVFLGEIPKETVFVASPMADPSVADDGEGGGLAAGEDGGVSDSPARLRRHGSTPRHDGRHEVAASGKRTAGGASSGAGRPAAPSGQGGDSSPRFCPGERVVHPKWGEGVVVGLDRLGARPGTVGELQLRVAFAGLGIKTILAGEVKRRER